MNQQNRMKNYIVLGDNAYYKDDYVSAIKFFQKALTFEGDVEERCYCLFNLGELFGLNGEPEQAFDCYSEILKVGDEGMKADAYYGIAILYEEQTNLGKARECFLKALELDAAHHPACYFLADVSDRLGLKLEAIKYYKRALSLDTEDFYSACNLGSLYHEEGNLESAKEYLDLSLQLQPNYYLALFNRGVVSSSEGDREAAIAYYLQAVKEKADFEFSYLNISALLIDSKEYEKAIELLSKGVEHNPSSADLFYNRACCLMLTGRVPEAIADLQQSILINPAIREFAKHDPDFASIDINDMRGKHDLH